ncbi:MAG: hypothetical protein IJ939_04455, partial [Clostridia bacterium]|nr:hypothetical protein [Clostridia bacterium]
MNDRNDVKKDRDIDLVDFSSNNEMRRIRENEMLERERRRKRAMQIRRAEIIRRKKIERIKKMIMAWGVLLLCLVAIVALVIGVVSLFKGDKNKNEELPMETVTPEETKLLEAFGSFDGVVFERDNTEGQYAPSAMNAMFSEMVTSSIDPLASPVIGSHLSMIADTYLWNASDDMLEKVKQIIRDYPMYSNGYVWSSENSMKHPVVSSYLYDTNAAYISAVCDICLWEGNTSFLDSVDMTGEAKSDISVGMTVGEKLDKAISHFFESDELNGGGVRYNAEDGLVYVLTLDNNGTSSGKPSNLFYNYRFGYIDTYNNIAFNAAMKDLSLLYTLTGDAEKAEKYASVAEVNKNAVNEKLYDSNLGRYIGCIDKEGESHDGGFTVINLMAVSQGIADKEKTESILEWIEGERNIDSDSHKNANAFSSLATPAFSTVEADKEWWFNADGNYSLDDEASFGQYWMNGARSVLAGNYYLLSGTEKHVRECVYNLAKLFDEGEFKVHDSDKTEPRIFYSLSASNAVREAFGVSTDGKTLSVNPLFNGSENIGINDISFAGNHYDVLYYDDAVYVMSGENAAVRLKLGGFSKNEMLVLTTVEKEIV